jgi:hypothetical protein
MRSLPVTRYAALAMALLVGCAANADPQTALLPTQSAARSVSMEGASGFTHCPAWPGGSGILNDGDFHKAPDPGYFQTYYKGQGFAPGWRVTLRSVDLYGGTVNKFPGGACSVDLDGSQPGAIEHAPIRTIKGANYTVTFLFSGNDGGPPATKTMKVEAAGQSETLQWDDANGGPEHGDYETEAWSFMATTTRTTLRFISQDQRKHDAHGPVVAAISITPN